MTRKLLTVDEFRASAKEAKDGAKPEGTVIRLAVADPQSVADADRKLRFVFSDATVDRAGDSIDPEGWEYDEFLKNPVALWAHDSYAPPIGRASNVGSSGGKLMGDIEFMTPDISDFADSIFRMVKGGFLKAVSVGFIPLEYSFVSEKDRPFGINFSKQELVEISVCPVPCNPNALQEAKAAGIDTGPLREWAAKLMDEGGHNILVPRNVLEETFRQAKTPRSLRQKYLSKAETPEWKVGAARDLPIDEAGTWDGAAAAKRMLDGSGFDGDSPDAAKAARGFLLHDGANPALRGSYKLPFADIVGGSLKAVKAGISAAKGRLDQTDAPAGVLADAQSVIDGYEKRMNGGKGNPKRGKAYAMALDEDDILQIVEVDEAPTTALRLKRDGKLVPLSEDALRQLKSGRRISSANEALLRKAMDDHMANASQCIKTVLDSIAPDDGDEPDEDDDKPTVIEVSNFTPKTEAEKRTARLAEAKALRASVKV